MRNVGAILLRVFRRPGALAACIGAACALVVVLVIQSFSWAWNRQIDSATSLDQQKFAVEIINRSLTSSDQRDNLANLAFYAKVGVLGRYQDNVLQMATAAGIDVERLVPPAAPATPMPDHGVVGGNPAPEKLYLALFGPPSASLTETCQTPTNKRLLNNVEDADVGPFQVQGLKPAVASLREILGKVKADNPGLYDRLGTGGMMCARVIRGSNRISPHAWGGTVDVLIDQKTLPYMDPANAGNPLYADYSLLARYFLDEGWTWGGPAEPNHFEISADFLIRSINLGAITL